jgi:hypothetical protein
VTAGQVVYERREVCRVCGLGESARWAVGSACMATSQGPVDTPCYALCSAVMPYGLLLQEG